jgi:hypothetical protein
VCCSELYVAVNGTPAGKALAAYLSGSVGQGTWESVASTNSQRFPLQAGQRVYLEALHKEGNGADHVAVGAKIHTTPYNNWQARVAPVCDRGG